MYFFNKDYTFYTKNLFIRHKNCIQSFLYKERCKKFRKNQFFSNIFTFLRVTLQNFEKNLRILANFGNFHVKTQKSTDFARTFKKKTFFFVCFNEDYICCIENLFIRPKIGFKAFFTTKDTKNFVKINFFSNIFTFLSITRQTFEDNLRILANFGKFSHKNSKTMDFAHTFSKNYSFSFFNKHYTFYNKNLFIRPKNCVQIILYNERCKEFRKNQFFSNIFTFLSVIRQNFEDNLRILANFGKLSRKNSKIY